MSQFQSNEQGQLSVSHISFNVGSPDTTINSTDNTNFSSSSILTKEECTSKICEILELDDSDQSKEIADKSITDGRQALRNYEQDFSPRIFRDEVNAIDSELLKLLKLYVEQQWYKSTPQWFQKYLQEQKINSSHIYDHILIRVADYGSKFIKGNTLLSLTIQFLFEFDNTRNLKTPTFDEIWETLITNGRQGIEKYADDIAPKILKEQLENDQSSLYLALQDYYSVPLKNLFEHHEVNIKPNIIKIALSCVTDDGWWKGLHDQKVQDEIAKTKFKKLIEKLNDYLSKSRLPISADASSNSTQLLKSSSVSSQSSATTTPTFSSDQSSNIQLASSTLNEAKSTTGIITNMDEETRSNECKMITKCIDEDVKLKLSNLVEAGELIYIDKKLNVILDEIIHKYVSQKKFSLFINDCLIPMMYLLKRHQNLDDFNEGLFQKYDELELSLKSGKLSLRMLIDILLLNSDFSLSRKILLLLSKRNSVPFLQPSLRNSSSYRFVSDIIHVWDYSIPVILSFGIGSCSGKSTTLNSIFLSSFEPSCSSIYFQNTIDIDFGYSFLPRRSMSIADAHGSMTKTLLKKIDELFDGFLIHVEYEYLRKNIDTVVDQLNVIMDQRKYRLLIIRDVPKEVNVDQVIIQLNTIIENQKHQLRIVQDVSTDNPPQCSNHSSSNCSTIQTYFLPNMSNNLDRNNKNHIIKLRNQILNKLPDKRIYDKDWINKELKILMNEDYKIHLREVNQTIKPLADKLLDTALNEIKVPKYFPEYLKFIRLCELKLKSARFDFYGCENDTVVYAVRLEIFELETAPKFVNRSLSVIFQLFIDVLKAPDVITCLELLSTQLKEERQCLVSETDKATQLPIQKSLSLEVLWRNAIVCSHNQPLETQKFLQKHYFDYIKAGFPFEIVDGDNFFFQHTFLLESLKPLRNCRTLVISIIGPQNSGKSTLLNYMFGTLFDVRDGRCTRGIYGSFVKSNRPDYDYIMLIDTEGLLSGEKADKEYDRRIVLFCLAVSHIVIVNMAGEISSTLQDMLKLCTDSLKNMGESTIPRPIVHFILNQKADLNIDNNRAAIQKIINDVKREGLDKSIDIREETFHTLPSAFKKEGQTLTSNSKLSNVVKTAQQFIECVHELSSKILNPTDQSLRRTSEISDPLQWLSSSITVFNAVQKFPDLTCYQDINERRIDNKLREHIRNNLIEMFSVVYSDELIAESLHKKEDEIKGIFLGHQSRIEVKARQDMENLFKLLEVPEPLRKRSQQFLNVQITEMFNALRTSTIAANEKEELKKLVRNGEGDLQKLIEDTIQSGKQMSKDAAEKEFELMYDNIVEFIESKYVPEERLKQAMKHIYTNYNIYEKESFFEYTDIITHLTMLTNLNETKQSIDQLEDPLIIHFTDLGYKHSSVSANPFNPTGTTIYSLDIIKNLLYLNKELLTREYVEFANNLSPQIESNKHKDAHSHQSKNTFTQFLGTAKAQLRGKKDNKDEPCLTVKSADQFQMQVREAIKIQTPKILQGSHVDDSDVYLRISKIFKEVIQRIIKAMQGAGKNEVRQIRTELIQKIVGLINTLIIEIKTELGPFCLELSRQLKSTLHSCAVVLLTKYYYNEQMDHFFETLDELKKKKDDLKEYFVTVVVPNSSIDKNYALNLGQQFREHLIKLFSSDGARIIEDDLKQYNCLNRKSVQDSCDQSLLTKNDSLWHLDYISNPNKIIEDFFNALWENIEKGINQNLSTKKSSYVLLLGEFFFCIKGLLDCVKNLDAPTRSVDDIFLSEEINALDANQNLINKKKCMAKLLYQYLTEGKIPTRLIVDEKVYNVRQNALHVFQSAVQQRKPSPELAKLIKDLKAVYEKISIGNLVIFLETLLEEKDKIINDFNQCKSDFKSIDRQDTYARLLDKVRGCPDLCPCCRRPCDVDHTQFKSKPGAAYNEHRCQSGHSLRAMNGYKFEATGEASLFMCEQIKDDQVIVIGPTRYQWSKFKNDHLDWSFKSALTEDELSKLHGKYLTIWIKIGPILCEQYGMTYVTHNSSLKVTHQSFHYILLLDGSGSMKGQRWNHLIEAVKEFLKRRTELATNDRITIIVFTESAKIIYLNKEIRDIDVKDIIFPAGNTSFGAAFRCVDDCISAFKKLESSDSVHESFAIIFMSDGNGDYFEKELDKLFKEHEPVIKRFWTIALGGDKASHTHVLEKINTKMSGSFYDVATSADLIKIYAEVASCTQLSLFTSK